MLNFSDLFHGRLSDLKNTLTVKCFLLTFIGKKNHLYLSCLLKLWWTNQFNKQIIYKALQFEKVCSQYQIKIMQKALFKHLRPSLLCKEKHIQSLTFSTNKSSHSSHLWSMLLTSYWTVFAMKDPCLEWHSTYLWIRSLRVWKQSRPWSGSCRAGRPRAAPCCDSSCSQTFPGRPAREMEKHITVRFQCEIHCPLLIP